MGIYRTLAWIAQEPDHLYQPPGCRLIVPKWIEPPGEAVLLDNNVFRKLTREYEAHKRDQNLTYCEHLREEFRQRIAPGFQILSTPFAFFEAIGRATILGGFPSRDLQFPPGIPPHDRVAYALRHYSNYFSRNPLFVENLYELGRAQIARSKTDEFSVGILNQAIAPWLKDPSTVRRLREALIVDFVMGVRDYNDPNGQVLLELGRFAFAMMGTGRIVSLHRAFDRIFGRLSDGKDPALRHNVKVEPNGDLLDCDITHLLLWGFLGRRVTVITEDSEHTMAGRLHRLKGAYKLIQSTLTKYPRYPLPLRPGRIVNVHSTTGTVLHDWQINRLYDGFDAIPDSRLNQDILVPRSR